MSKTKTNGFKKGTIGYAAAQLVKRYGRGTTGLTILERALQLATDTTAVEYRIGNQESFLTNTPGYVKAAAAEDAICARCRIVFYKPELNVAYKLVDKGTRTVGIRFAPGTTREEMEQCVAGVRAHDWEPYDSSTNTFLTKS